jgi:hypothetical protein
MYRRRFFIVFSIIILIVVVLTWYRFDQLDGSREIVHETNRWAVIEDIDGNHIAVEPTDNDVWNILVELNQNKTRLWIGGKIEEYGNKWGFRFKPESIAIAQITAEGLQGKIQFISDDLDYWESLGVVYISAIVIEVHT